MILSYKKSDTERRIVSAEIFINHDGKPYIELEGGKVLDLNTWATMDFKVVHALSIEMEVIWNMAADINYPF